MRIDRLAHARTTAALAAALALVAGPALAQQAADPASKPVQVAAANTGTAAKAPAGQPLKRNAGGQIESTETRDWSKIDRNGDNLISPDEMQAYLDASKR